MSVWVLCAVVHRQVDWITDTCTNCVGEVFDLVFSAWTLGTVYLVKEPLSHAQSVTMLAEETVPQMYYFNRNCILVSHTILCYLKFNKS